MAPTGAVYVVEGRDHSASDFKGLASSGLVAVVGATTYTTEAANTQGLQWLLCTSFVVLVKVAENQMVIT